MTAKTTIETTFDPSALPRWAQSHPAVIARCARDLAFRCDVCSAKTQAMRNMLIRSAQ